MFQPIDGKTLVFRFVGGPDDGQEVRADPPIDSYGAAYALWAVTRKGTKGRRFSWHSSDGKSHRYKVVEKRETAHSITVTCELVGA